MKAIGWVPWLGGVTGCIIFALSVSGRKRFLFQAQSKDSRSSLPLSFSIPAPHLDPRCFLCALDPVPLQLSRPGGATTPSDCGLAG